ncbi:MAG TPA: protease pro-enzyme activation domain-containing protein [Caulobacteraceae bacterium]|jgi:subtilase family serine protease|nr:protease pro-enzyme activation domain-containing protein [Caulobacteraceae bacterium]
MKQHLLAGSLIAATALAASNMAAAAAPTVVPSTQSVRFSVYLPLRNTAAMKSLLAAQQTKGSASYHQWLTPAQVAAQFGPTQASITQATTALTAAGFQVTATHMRSIDVMAAAGTVNQTLQTTLKSVPSSTGGTRIIASGRVIVPQSLAAVGASIPTFAAVPEHHPMGHVLAAAPANRTSPVGGYNYNDLKQAYDYPAYSSLDGRGAHVAIVMESNAQNSDVAAMFNHENFTATTGKAPPTYTYVPIDGGGVYGGVNDGGTDEAELDVQMVLGGAPGASVSLLGLPDLSDQHILDAYTLVIESGAFDIVTNSFGECELFYTPAYNNGYDFTSTLALYDEFFELGNLEGVTWFVSSGDEGGPGCPSNNIIPYFIGLTGGPTPHFIKGVSTPAVDPNVTAVGGGNLITSFKSGSLQSTYVSEQGFGDPEIPYDEFGIGEDITGGYWGAGGGISQIFAKPSYQSLVNSGSTTFRTLPDIGMLVGGCPGGISKLPCGPDRAYVIVTIGGARYGFIGTSVSSPELAGATALLVQFAGGRLGNINPGLYTLSAIQIAAGGASAPAADQFYHQNIPGFDGAYTVTSNTGYNFIYGNGSPDIRHLFGMTGLPAAGNPQTASNP